MSIYKKFIILLEFPTRPGEVIEFTPFHINMLNALEETAKCRHTDGKLTEITPTYWEFQWPHTGGTAKMRIRMTDEELSAKEPTSKHPKLAPPRFK
jgi:hypothetical protein